MLEKMIPQHFPLHCVNKRGHHFIVIGWMSAGSPVVVRETFGDRQGPTSKPQIMDEPVRYRLPEIDASISTLGAIDVRKSD